MTLHITEFEGGRALSEFRIRQLLPRLREVNDKVEGLSARFVHLAAWEQAPAASDLKRLAGLLTYGEPFEGGTQGEHFGRETAGDAHFFDFFGGFERYGHG